MKFEIKHRYSGAVLFSLETPEPWDNDGSLILVEATGRLIAQCFDNIGVAPKEANARRIVACVNACAGMPDSMLSAGLLKQHIEALGENAAEGYPGIAHDFETMRQERDALAAACNGLLARLISHQNVHCKTVLASDVEALRAALALVERGKVDIVNGPSISESEDARRNA